MDMTDNDGWPDTVHLSASNLTGKIYGHLQTAKGRREYTRTDLAQSLADALEYVLGQVHDAALDQQSARAALANYRKGE